MKILSSAKHFPGHGDTSTDSHKTLPFISHDKKRILKTELKPFKTLINNGLESVMIAHLEVPSLEKTKGLPSTLSYSIVTSLLKNTLGFKGLIITDALEMKGLSNFKSKGNLDMLAFKAGNDVLLMSANVSEGIKAIVDEYNLGEISEERLSYSVKKILKAKYKVGLNNFLPISKSNIYNDLNSLENKLLNEELVEKAITVVKNNVNILPIKNLKNSIGYLNFGNDNYMDFFDELTKYSKIDNLDEIDILKTESTSFIESNYKTIIIGVHANSETPWKSYNLKKEEIIFINRISKKVNVILNIFGSPYMLNRFKNIKNINGIIISYQNSKVFQKKSAQLIFGAIESTGILPVSIGKLFSTGQGLELNKINRLSYGLPESVNLSSEKLNKIDSLAQIAIDSSMTPGVQILVAKDGKVIYDKNFGYLTYKKKQRVNHNTIYDVASLTKILVTLPIVMKMVENGKLSLDTQLKEIIDWAENILKERAPIHVRLVKGAYWDYEIKQSQIKSHPGYSVFTNKNLTDLSYLHTAKKIFDIEKIYPKFATHNAHTIAAIYHMGYNKIYEFQRLFGMGELLYDSANKVCEHIPKASIYAPIGAYKDLLPYLVRRLLENGANSSFINRLLDSEVDPKKLAENPAKVLESKLEKNDLLKIQLPKDMFNNRINSPGLDLTERENIDNIKLNLQKFKDTNYDVQSSFQSSSPAHEIKSLCDGGCIGSVKFDGPEIIINSFSTKSANYDWGKTNITHRTSILKKMADLIKAFGNVWM